jgi:hypothetical protein
MKIVVMMMGLLMSAACVGANVGEMPADKIKSLVSAENEASNRMMLSGSKESDVDALFAMYSDDFLYIHEVYGGQYTREHLYKNSVRNLNAGRYKNTEGRYRIMNILTGLNAAAVERLEVKSGKVHLTVFEFKGEKISKITEYWK